MDILTVQQKFTCPICFDIPKQKIFQCRNGHIICEQCSRSLYSCPQCRISFEASKIRNLALEDMLKELTSLQKTTVFEAKGHNQAKHKSYKLKNNTILFKVRCQWCGGTPLRFARYVCLSCRDVNCCAVCFSRLSSNGFPSPLSGTCKRTHSFALITTIDQDKAFQEIFIQRNGEPVLQAALNRPDSYAKCQRCNDWLVEGYIYLRETNCKLFCSRCHTKTEYFERNKNNFFAIANQAGTILQIQYQQMQSSESHLEQPLSDISAYFFIETLLCSALIRLWTKAPVLIIFLICFLSVQTWKALYFVVMDIPTFILVYFAILILISMYLIHWYEMGRYPETLIRRNAVFRSIGYA